MVAMVAATVMAWWVAEVGLWGTEAAAAAAVWWAARLH